MPAGQYRLHGDDGRQTQAGALFDYHDDVQSQPVAVINETMARQFWSGENALGKRFKLGSVDSQNHGSPSSASSAT